MHTKEDSIRKIGINFEVIGKRLRRRPKPYGFATGVHPDLVLNRERWRHYAIADLATKRADAGEGEEDSKENVVDIICII